MNYKVISFYTENYKDEVAILIDSLKRFKMVYEIELVKSKGAWEGERVSKNPFHFQETQAKLPTLGVAGR